MAILFVKKAIYYSLLLAITYDKGKPTGSRCLNIRGIGDARSNYFEEYLIDCYMHSILYLYKLFMYYSSMIVPKEELIAVMRGFNPWWHGGLIHDLPQWHRSSYNELRAWILNPPSHRAIFLSGARQVGKTTLFLQAIDDLLKSGIPDSNILYATFDHPCLKLSGIDSLMEIWREIEPKAHGQEYIFLDEGQFIENWPTWVKHQVDFFKQRKIFLTGFAFPILQPDQESGLGRLHHIRLTTLSFYEYIQLKKIELPPLPQIRSIKTIFQWNHRDISHAQELGKPYLAYFHHYLIHSGFPQIALISSIDQAQKLLREDIIDKALKRDMTALFGVRRVLDLEKVFLYLCRHDGGIIDISCLASNLGVTRPTAQNFILFLESMHLIYRIEPFGYGKEILRGKYKIYLADPAISPAVMLKGRSFMEDPASLGIAAESAVIKHILTHYYQQNVQFSYWRGKKDFEVDLIASIDNRFIPFEVKYRSHGKDIRRLNGLNSFCNEKKVSHGYIVTREISDFGLIDQNSDARLVQVPAPLFCYWMGLIESFCESIHDSC